MPVPHVLLRLLIDGPSHGYDLHRKLRVFRDIYPLNNVNVYPALRELQGRALVRSRTELVDSRARKIYEITPAGEAELERWVDAAPEAFLSEEKDLLALKIVLAPDREGPQLDWLAASLESNDEEIERVRAQFAKQRDGGVSRLALLTAEYRLRAIEQRREYLHAAMRIARGDEGRAGMPGKRVLVVDDSIASRLSSRYLLSNAGYEVALAEDGAQAWELLHETRFDALVSDALMPELDGFELLRRVRTDDGLARLPVVLNTVLEDPEERDAALAAGADEFVCKNAANAGRLLLESVRRLTGESESRTS